MKRLLLSQTRNSSLLLLHNNVTTTAATHCLKAAPTITASSSRKSLATNKRTIFNLFGNEKAAPGEEKKVLTGQKDVKPNSPQTNDDDYMNRVPPLLRKSMQGNANMTKLSIPGVENIIVVASGKGGVGKSTVSTNLALALSRSAKVGLLDADIYGPSIHRMMKVQGKPEVSEITKMLIPKSNYGIKVMSMGLIVEEDVPAIWRGPMVMSALEQMLRQVEWGELDIMVIDLPPGTGDAHLTLSQRVPISGAVIVSTPQDIALIDARRAANMFRKVNVPIFGVVENMSYYKCRNCGHEEHIFGHEGAKATADQMGLDFLGEIPLHVDIRTTSDEGKPITISDAKSPYAQPFFDIAGKVLEKLNQNAESGNEASAGPKIIIEE